MQGFSLDGSGNEDQIEVGMELTCPASLKEALYI